MARDRTGYYVGEELKAHLNTKTGFADPPVADCTQAQGLKCPLREDTDRCFECLPNECRFLTRWREEDRRKQEEGGKQLTLGGKV